MNKHQEHSRSFRLRDPPKRWHSSIAAQIDSYSKQFQNKSCNLKKKKIQTQNHNINHLYDQQKPGSMKYVSILININLELLSVRDRDEEEKSTNNKFKSIRRYSAGLAHRESWVRFPSGARQKSSVPGFYWRPRTLVSEHHLSKQRFNWFRL